MAGQSRQLCGLTLSFVGVLGVALTCGLPMWRETSFVGANIVTAQSVWDGLWLHCVVQATGQMQCHQGLSLTSDLQAGRALTLISVICAFLGFMVARCSVSRIQGGGLVALSGLLCLIAVSWSAGVTNFFSNDPLLIQALKRDVGSSVYIGLISSVLLLLSALLIGLVCWENDPPPPQPSEYSGFSDRTQRTVFPGFASPNRTSRYKYADISPESLYS
uniref:Claudin n=1 Tax=Knipowitschia caucasica TaxID=637954 RepID=A0AAV2J5X3_KNICA